MRSFDGLLLILPAKPDVERDAVAQAWQARGGDVLRLDRFWRPPPVDRVAARLYGPDVFALLVAQLLDLSLTSPADDLIFSVPHPLLHRTVEQISLQQALESNDFPWFFKSVVPKQFPARVYADPAALQAETDGLEMETAVMRSAPVRLVWEARAFVFEGEVLDHAVYEGDGAPSTQAIHRFVDRLGQAVTLPPTCVVDVGWIAGAGLALIEFNAAWGAGLNGCRAERVVDAIAAATRPGDDTMKL